MTTTALQARYDQFYSLGLDLDLTRGKPSVEQNQLAMPMFEHTATRSPTGIDCLDYGSIEGLPEARELFGAMLGAPKEQTCVFGGGSLNVMQAIIAEMLLVPLPGQDGTWRDLPDVYMDHRPAMLCPVPGYDRHYNICKRYGINMVPIPMLPDGLDMDEVERLVQDQWVVGMFCVPIHSNPNGEIYSIAVCERLARMRAGNPKFRIIWDLAYVVHEHGSKRIEIPNMFGLCKKAGHEDRIFVVGSTSKITCPDAGLGILAGSPANMDWVRNTQFIRSIGTNKVLQNQHVRFLQNTDGIRRHMDLHRAILRPKFELVETMLSRDLGSSGIATWSQPRGGYFVGLSLKQGSAKRVVERCGNAGLKVTPAGSCHPTGDDTYIRIAPTFSPEEKLRPALELFTTCVLLEAARAR